MPSLISICVRIQRESLAPTHKVATKKNERFCWSRDAVNANSLAQNAKFPVIVDRTALIEVVVFMLSTTYPVPLSFWPSSNTLCWGPIGPAIYTASDGTASGCVVRRSTSMHNHQEIDVIVARCPSSSLHQGQYYSALCTVSSRLHGDVVCGPLRGVCICMKLSSSPRLN